MSIFLLTIVARTPLWVWFLLAALIALGLSQARDHVVGRVRVIAQPVGLGLFSLWGAMAAFGMHAQVQGVWLAGLLAGAAAGWLLVLPRQVQALSPRRFAIGGSLVPLVLLMAVFFMRYAINVALAIRPALAQQLEFATAAAALYGAPAGLLAARAWRVLASAGRKPALQAA